MISVRKTLFDLFFNSFFMFEIAIADPRGNFVTGPLIEEKGIVYADIFPLSSFLIRRITKLDELSNNQHLIH
ncbi:MAG: hypothetical protein ACW981_07410 [Candidatus Hodarchaeales archaeon]|jgi:hypothetical protein